LTHDEEAAEALAAAALPSSPECDIFSCELKSE
jgi:hypothetical protein